LVALLKTIVRPVPHRMVGDAYNLFPNGRMTGTVGTAGKQVSGTVATNFTAQMVSGGSNTTVVADLLPNPDTGGSIQRFQFTTHSSVNTYEVFGFYGSTFTPPPNQWVKARARVKLTAWVGWRSIYFDVGNMDCFGAVATTDQIASDSDVDLEIESMPFLQPASPSPTRPWFWIYIDPRVSVSDAVVEVKEFEYVKVDDPRYLHNTQREASPNCCSPQ
jgi:hypothetical protein